MLIEFTVGNFRSFKDRVTLSMLASSLKAEQPNVDDENVFHLASGLPLLKIGAVYGPNASGKSNLTTAFDFMQDFVLNSSKDTQAGEETGVEQFLLDEQSSQEPAYFEIVFIENDTLFRYGFELNSNEVVREWLYNTINGKRETRLFLRIGQEFTSTKAFIEAKGLQNRTRINALYLSVVAQFNGPISQRVLSWFRRFNVVSGLDDKGYRLYTVKCMDDPDKRNDVVDFVKSLDLDVQDIATQTSPVTPELLPDDIPDNIRKILVADGWSATMVTTKHRVYGVNGEQVGTRNFDMDEQESHGTQKLFSLAGPIMDTLRHGKVLVIDEFDSRLHPRLSRALVRLFQSKIANPKNAQLIFTTHDTSMLDRHLFRRDQLWFVEKDKVEASHLTSLAEFRIRNDASFEELYLSGRIGAVPFLAELNHLFEASDD